MSYIPSGVITVNVKYTLWLNYYGQNSETHVRFLDWNVYSELWRNYNNVKIQSQKNKIAATDAGGDLSPSARTPTSAQIN